MNTPPPLPVVPPAFKASRRLTNKLLMIAFVMVVMQVPLWMVRSTRDERARRHAEAVSSITGAWGGAQRVTGPLLVVPYRWRDDTATPREFAGELRLAPAELNVVGELAPQTLKRGIYRARVYHAGLRLTGRFVAPLPAPAAGREWVWEQARLVLAIGDGRGLRGEQSLAWAGQPLDWQTGTGLGRWPQGVQRTVSIAAGDEVEFAIDINLDGSGALEFVPTARNTRVELASDWPAPSFQGAFLPTARNVDESGFSSNWAIGHLGRDLPESWRGDDEDDYVVSERMQAAAFGVALLPSVDDYRTVERSIKYGILFLVTIFAGFFLGEMTGGQPLHLLNYLLVGAALCLFYLALLALAEFVHFGWAYAAAAGFTALMVGLYAVAVLGETRGAARISGLLVGIYGYLYFVLRLEDLSLIAGTALLFGLLGAVMYATRHLRFDDEARLAGGRAVGPEPAAEDGM